MNEYAFGIDLGGTTAKVGFFTVKGALLEKWEVPTDNTHKGENILRNLAKSIQARMKKNDLTKENVIGVGFGVPGPVTNQSYVPICANLGGWGDLDVAANLSALLDGIPVKVGNDADVAALGETWRGTAEGCRSMVMVTLGTGVGGGVIINRKIVEGSHGAGGEIGHITVNPNETATCGCGKKGCLEQYSSATGIVRCMKLLLASSDEPCVLRDKAFTAKDVIDAARNGDALALRELNDFTNTLGYAMATISTTVDPDMFLIGGGVSRGGDIITDAVTAAYKKYAFHECRETPIKVASLGNDAGIYGAVRMVAEND